MSNVSLNRVGRSQTGPASRSNKAGKAKKAEHSPAVGEIDSVVSPESGFAEFSNVLSNDPPPEAKQTALEPITQYLGHELTVANPAWTGDPVPYMRSLQRKLIEHALALSPESRKPCLQAIEVVEKAVQHRLRFQQMSMQGFDEDSGTGEQK